MYIPVMTMVWQLSTTKECMDGIPLLIKAIFPPSLDISQILCCSYQSSVIQVLRPASQHSWDAANPH